MSSIKLQNGKAVIKNGKISCDCCVVCIDEQFSISGIPLNRCAATQYGVRTIYRPSGVLPAPTPIPVRIRGTVDDELIVDGVITQLGQFPYFVFPACNGAHEVTVDFTMTAASFTIAAGDNHGGFAGYDLSICFGGISISPP